MGDEDLLDECLVAQTASLMPGAAADHFRETLNAATDRLLADLEDPRLSRDSRSFALHSLRGMVANIGFRAASERAGALQLAAMDDALPGDAAAELRRLIEASLEAMDRRLIALAV